MKIFILNSNSFTDNSVPKKSEFTETIKKMLGTNPQPYSDRTAIVFDTTDYDGPLKDIIDGLQAMGGQRADYWKSNDSSFWGNISVSNLKISKVIEIISQEFDSIFVVASDAKIESEKIMLDTVNLFKDTVSVFNLSAGKKTTSVEQTTVSV